MVITVTVKGIVMKMTLHLPQHLNPTRSNSINGKKCLLVGTPDLRNQSHLPSCLTRLTPRRILKSQHLHLRTRCISSLSPGLGSPNVTWSKGLTSLRYHNLSTSRSFHHRSYLDPTSRTERQASLPAEATYRAGDFESSDKKLYGAYPSRLKQG